MLPRPSNKGILISAVLVGLLGLGANWFVRLDPKVVDDYANQINQMVANKTKQAVEISAMQSLSPKAQHHRFLKRDCERIEQAFDNWKQEWKLPTKVRNQLPGWAANVQEFSKLISENPKTTPIERRETNLQALVAAFRAGQINPACKKFFRLISENIESEQFEPLNAARVAGLRIVTKHDLRRPNKNRLIADLKAFTRNHPSERAGGDIYVMVAQELLRQGDPRFAKQIASLGAQLYKGEARGRLLNELISLKTMQTYPVSR